MHAAFLAARGAQLAYRSEREIRAVARHTDWSSQVRT